MIILYIKDGVYPLKPIKFTFTHRAHLPCITLYEEAVKVRLKGKKTSKTEVFRDSLKFKDREFVIEKH
jgi:hypothetical protein